MLTNEQITKLNLLTSHPRYGFIVQKAIEVWSGETNPAKNNWGIETTNGIWKLYTSCCCLIATTLISKKQELAKPFSRCIITEASKHLNLDPWEVFAMVEGFDKKPKDPNMEVNKDFVNAYEFGQMVNRAIWG